MFRTPLFSVYRKESSTGTIKANLFIDNSHFPLANSLDADCEEGAIELSTNILPGPNTRLRPNPMLRTSIAAGSAIVRFHGPIPPERAIIRSSHIMDKGIQRVFFPLDWKGVVLGRVQVGTCDIWGNGVEIVKDRGNETGLNVYVKAVKGDQKCAAQAQTVIHLRSGTVEVGIGSRLHEPKGTFSDRLLLVLSPFMRMFWSFLWTIIGFVYARLFI